jgi:prepilin-type N-terminal cleavage/methylation domain-containing protein
MGSVRSPSRMVFRLSGLRGADVRFAKRTVGRLRRDQRGFTLIELITALGMLLIVITALSGVLISATNIEADMNRRFSSQINARIALDQLRREIHCAISVSPIAPAVSVAQGVTIVLGSRCPSATGGTTVSWCTSGSGTRWALYREVGPTCSSASPRKAVDYLTDGNVFTFTNQSTSSLAYVSVALSVNTNSASGEIDYRLTDDIVLRNSTRA